MIHQNNSLNRGRVLLTGAGPGDPGLLTVKAREAIMLADVILHDGLVNDSILAFADPDAEIIDVSKRAGNPLFTQSKINEIMIQLAQEGNQVVRLKCGDPFVFGRGAEEALALTEAGVDWEVIPGVSAGLAVPAYAGVPLTHRKLSSSVAFVTGQEDPNKPEAKVDWAKLANAVDTIVIFMGLGQIRQMANSLIEAGRQANTPVAVVESGTYLHQRTVTGTLENIAEAIIDFQSPSLIIIGEVVDLRSALNWFDPTLRFTTETQSHRAKICSL